MLFSYQKEVTVSETNSLPKKSFAELLAEFMARANMNNAQLARTSGINTNTISELLNGRRKPQRPTVIWLSRGLSLPARERDELLISAGYLPESQVLNDLLRMLLSPEMREEDIHAIARDARTTVEMRRAGLVRSSL